MQSSISIREGYAQRLRQTANGVKLRFSHVNLSSKMLFLTVVACEIGRNGYFSGTDQRTGSGCLVGIMGNLSYK